MYMSTGTIYLKKFNTETQLYGTYFKGFDWTIIGCLTFKYKVSSQNGEARVKNFMRRLGKKLKNHIPYIAVPEYKHSGLGHPHTTPLSLPRSLPSSMGGPTSWHCCTSLVEDRKLQDHAI